MIYKIKLFDSMQKNIIYKSITNYTIFNIDLLF